MEDLSVLKENLINITKNTYNEDMYAIIENTKIKRNILEYNISSNIHIGYVQVRRIFFLLEIICEDFGYIAQYSDMLEVHRLVFKGDYAMKNYIVEIP